jgi:hypothetical protein
MDKETSALDPEEIRKFLIETTNQFGDEFITIGGWAVNAYACKGKSLDGDAMISFQTEGTLRDFHILEKNPRMKKSQLLCPAGCDIDLYVEHQHGLKIPFEEVQAYHQKRQGLNVPCPEHLLILKLEAFKERRNSAKGQKDKEDLIQMLGKLEFKHPEISEVYLEEDDFQILEEVSQDTACAMRVCDQNAQAGKSLRKNAQEGLLILQGRKKSREKPAPPTPKPSEPSQDMS